MISPFITFRELEDGKLNYYILQTKFPHFLGMIMQEEPTNALATFPISGYNLHVVIKDTLRGGIPSYKNILEDCHTVAQTMAAWFRADRIVGNEKKFLKFKI